MSELPTADAILDERTAFVGTTGSGKTYTAKGFAEQLLEKHVRICIVDPLGVWWGLRFSADRSAPGFDVVVFGGKYGDVEITEHMGDAIGLLVVTRDMSCIIDLSGLTSAAARRRFMTHFAETVYEKNSQPLHLILDEADLWCLSEDTELLTIDGWTTYDKIEIGQLAVCFDLAAQKYVFAPVQRVITKQYSGPMVHLKTKSLDCLSTPDHRVVLERMQRAPGRYTGSGYGWAFCPAGDVPTCVRIPSGGAPIGSGIPGLDVETARVLGWLIADGAWHDTKAKSKRLTLYQAEASVKRGVSITGEMESVLSAWDGISTHVKPAGIRNGKNASESTRWYFGGTSTARLTPWLAEDMHRVRHDIIVNASREQLQALYDGLLEGDGSSDDGETWSHFYPGLDEGLADDFQEIALRLGISTTKTQIPVRLDWCVSIASERKSHHLRKPATVNYEGIVWDVTVPTGAFVARRNGRIFVTGNCPQRPRPELLMLMNRIDEIVRRGRVRGFIPWLISQRPAVINKDVLSQVTVLIAMRLTSSQDRDALGAWIEGQADKAQGKAILAALPQLQDGEGYIWAPKHKILEVRKFPLIRTFDSSKTPKRGEKVEEISALPALDVSELAGLLAKDAPSTLPAANKASVTAAAIEKARAEGNAAATAAYRDQILALQGRERELLAVIRGALGFLAPHAEVRDGMPVVDVRTPPPPPVIDAAPVKQSTSPPAVRKGGGGAEMRILAVLASRHPIALTEMQWATLAGMKRTGGTWGTYKSRLRVAGRIEQVDGRWSLTSAGLNALGGELPPAQTGAELIEVWAAAVGGGAAKLLRAIANRSNGLTRAELAAAVDMEPTGGTFGTYLSRLRSNDLIETRDGRFVLAEILR